jgi:hypothetical protein
MRRVHSLLIAVVLTAETIVAGVWAGDVRADNSRRDDAIARYSVLELGERAFCRHSLNEDLLVRTELFFGLSRPGGVVTEEEFQTFLDTEVTSRFPDGLTLLSGKGQFKNSAGTIVQEGSKLLILIYPFSTQSNAAVEEIRTQYKASFQQESVLRTDERSCVSF